MKKILSLSALAMLSVSTIAFAQDAATGSEPDVEAPAAETVEAPLRPAAPLAPQLVSEDAFGSWTVRCFDDGACYTSKRDVLAGEGTEDERGSMMTVNITPDQGAVFSMATDVPVLLSAGVFIFRDREVIGTPFWKGDFTSCADGECLAQNFVDVEILKAFPGSEAAFVTPDGQVVAIKGEFDENFVKALDAMKQKTADATGAETAAGESAPSQDTATETAPAE